MVRLNSLVLRFGLRGWNHFENEIEESRDQRGCGGAMFLVRLGVGILLLRKEGSTVGWFGV